MEWIGLGVVAVIAAVLYWRHRPRWRDMRQRDDARPLWQAAFPGLEREVALFLDVMSEAFMVPVKAKSKVRPTDRIMDLYHRSTGSWPVDSMELESLMIGIEEHFSVDVTDNEDFFDMDLEHALRHVLKRREMAKQED